MNEKIAEILKPLAKSATKLNLQKARSLDDLSVVGTHFGGEPYSGKGEAYPICKTCRKLLTFICQINTSEGFHKKHEAIKLFTFFYCWDCFPWGLSDEEKGQWAVRIYTEPHVEKFDSYKPDLEIEYPTNPCITSIEEIVVYPKWDEIDYWSKEILSLAEKGNNESPWEEYDSTVNSLGGFDEFATTIGGYAFWMQSEETRYCDVCENHMQLLAQIDSEEKAGLTWGDVGLVYLFFCENHPSEINLILQCF